MRLIDADALDEVVLNLNTNRDFGITRGDYKLIDSVLFEFPTIEERKTGKWLERHHAYADEEKVIEEWQSCKCSVCGRYDTRPYLYYFSEPRFCSWCGADMRGEGHE